MADKGAEAAVVGVLVLSGAQLFHQATPDLKDVRSAGPDDAGMAAAVRTGEASAVATVMLAGVALWQLTGELAALLLASGICAVGIATYEAALRSAPQPSPAPTFTRVGMN